MRSELSDPRPAPSMSYAITGVGGLLHVAGRTASARPEKREHPAPGMNAAILSGARANEGLHGCTKFWVVGEASERQFDNLARGRVALNRYVDVFGILT